jgi:hypothetical protein
MGRRKGNYLILMANFLHPFGYSLKARFRSTRIMVLKSYLFVEILVSSNSLYNLITSYLATTSKRCLSLEGPARHPSPLLPGLYRIITVYLSWLHSSSEKKKVFYREKLQTLDLYLSFLNFWTQYKRNRQIEMYLHYGNISVTIHSQK